MANEMRDRLVECCVGVGDCNGCPYRSFVGKCTEKRNADAIALINRQQAEIDTMLEDLQFRTNQVIEQQAEIERLEELFNEWKKQAYKAVDEKEELYSKALEWVRSAKAIAITEFAERLKDRCNWGGEIYCDDIDNLVKEMVGDDK